jgi:Rrf2 family protein
MKLTSQEEYGLRCLIQVARRQGAGPVPIRAISEAEGLSQEYVAKLLRVLRKGDLLVSVRGATGGYLLAMPVEDISVWTALQALDSPLYTPEFCTGHAGKREQCVHSGTGCSIRVLWQWVDTALQRALERVTLADLLGGASPVASALGPTLAELS